MLGWQIVIIIVQDCACKVVGCLRSSGSVEATTPLEEGSKLLAI